MIDNPLFDPWDTCEPTYTTRILGPWGGHVRAWCRWLTDRYWSLSAAERAVWRDRWEHTLR